MADDLSQLEKIAGRFEAASERLADALARQHTTGSVNSNITLNAGGMALWLAVSACGVMLAVNLCLAVMLINHDRKIDDLRHVLNAIYMMAPNLKPKEE